MSRGFYQRIPSVLAELDPVCARARNLLIRNGIRDELFGVDLLLREFMNNAVVHGNGQDAARLVRVGLRLWRRWIVLRVVDEGAGFDWRNGCGEMPDADADRGRGVAIGRLYARHLRYHGRGHCVTLWIEVHTTEGDSIMPAFTRSRDGQTLRLGLGEKLTSTVVPELKKALKEERDAGVRELVIDFAQTTTVDSTGIGLLIAAHNSLAAAEGGVRLENVNPDIFKLLRSMRLVERLRVTPAM